MPKVRSHEIDKKEKIRIVEEMFEIFGCLKSKPELMSFMIGFLTPSEVLMLARRIQIAKMLIEEKTYGEIERKLRVSHMTIGRIEQWLRNDEEIEKIFKNKIKTSEKKNERKKSNSSMLDRYPQHRFLKELLGL